MSQSRELPRRRKWVLVESEQEGLVDFIDTLVIFD
jgi:hypothetical protein